MLQKNFTLLLALVSTAWAVPIRREVPQGTLSDLSVRI